MEAWMAFVSIMAIVAIVVVAGGLIAFIGHMILSAFDNGKQGAKQENKDVIDYAQYKQLTSGNEKIENKEYDFEAINESKAKKEKELLEKEVESTFDLDLEKDEELEKIEQRLQEEVAPVKVEAKEEVKTETDDIDDFDLDNMLSEISNDIIEEEKSQVEEDVKMSDELASYSIDDLLKQAEEAENVEEMVEDVEPAAQDAVLTQDESDEDEIKLESEEVKQDDILEAIEEDEDLFESNDATYEVEDAVEETVAEPVVDERNEEIEKLKAQLAELNKQLEEARTSKVEVVKIDTTEEECLERIAILEERLKLVKKDYKSNAKEYRPLKKVMNDLERYQTKLRRKEAVVAKKKVSLYGVNNYVDIDKEKAEKLANELELLDGLRLSVSHCEEVINANKDRFPVLEHTNQILEDQIAHIEADIASAQAILQKIREKNGNGEGSNEGTEE